MRAPNKFLLRELSFLGLLNPNTAKVYAISYPLLQPELILYYRNKYLDSYDMMYLVTYLLTYMVR